VCHFANDVGGGIDNANSLKTLEHSNGRKQVEIGWFVENAQARVRSPLPSFALSIHPAGRWRLKVGPPPGHMTAAIVEHMRRSVRQRHDISAHQFFSTPDRLPHGECIPPLTSDLSGIEREPLQRWRTRVTLSCRKLHAINARPLWVRSLQTPVAKLWLLRLISDRTFAERSASPTLPQNLGFPRHSTA
jgi:hypothetical protein